MFEVSQVSVFIRFRVLLGDGHVSLAKERGRCFEHKKKKTISCFYQFGQEIATWTMQKTWQVYLEL